MKKLDDPGKCVDDVIASVGKDIRLAAPLGAGKANHLLNAFYQRAKSDPEISLVIYSALTLERPKGKSDLEKRFLEPMVERVFGNYPDLDYELDRVAGKLPDNVRVIEFYLPAGKFKNNAQAQQDYISSNYTHVARDLLGRGVNVLAQQVAWREEDGRALVSLSCNPDVSLDIMEALDGRDDVVFIGQTNGELPFMYGDAVVEADRFDFIVHNPELDYKVFGPPKMSISDADYMIGLYASTLIRDGGELQVGIGSLGDSIVYGLKLRQEDNPLYLRVLEQLSVLERTGGAVLAIGDLSPFEEGLFAASEMLVDGFMYLYKANIIKRRVYDDVILQRLLGQGLISEEVTPDTLRQLIDHKAVHLHLDEADFDYLTHFGVFKPGLRYQKGAILTEDGERIAAKVVDEASFEAVCKHCLGTRLDNGAVIHAGFFLGPEEFYQWLREMPEDERRLINMRSVTKINQLYGHEAIDRLQRRYARFVNTGMMVTLSGAVVSDALEDGTVISGVGGQYNFVSMAHALPDGRSILQVRSTNKSGGELRSSVVWNYGHVTIPRHLRDIIVTEYGIADLRGKTDEEVVKELLNITDSRFQEELMQTAKEAGKLAEDYQIPERYRSNTPESYALPLAELKKEELFPLFPFGTDLTEEEIILGGALRRLKGKMESGLHAVEAVAEAVAHGGNDEDVAPYLRRMGLENPEGLKEKLYQRLLTAELRSDPRVV
jgi:acyl-CoA hydrolase